MKIATWNVNGINARTEHLLRWLKDFNPDVALLQELKTPGDAVPALELKEFGYHIEYVGQKSFNGVAVLSKSPIEVVLRALPGNDDDEQARYLEVDTGDVRVASIYFPNGNPVDSEKFDYKLNFMERVIERTKDLLSQEIPFVLGGDYNVAPDNGDVYDIQKMANDAICREEGRRLYRQHLHLGLTNAFKLYHPESGQFSWWDYRAGGWTKDHGVLIDHLLLSPHAADLLSNAGIDKTPRGWEKASDHTPVWCELEI
ncbi:MAG: exodeoxyribonuclease III [Terasakiella sp.]|uniref:exodeoxyribonuclease III n=1 Tax=unclassified Terasakiella TaxID=2614952 RepID=UPI003AFFEF9A